MKRHLGSDARLGLVKRQCGITNPIRRRNLMRFVFWLFGSTVSCGYLGYLHRQNSPDTVMGRSNGWTESSPIRTTRDDMK